MVINFLLFFYFSVCSYHTKFEGNRTVPKTSCKNLQKRLSGESTKLVKN